MLLKFFAGLIRRLRTTRAAAVMFDQLEGRTLFAVPSAPSSLSASVVSSNTQIQLKWSDKSSNESGFEVFRGTSSGSLSKVATVGKNATSYKQTPPSKGKTYYYKVRAYNSSGESGATSTVSAKLPTQSAPAAPTSLSASVFSGTQIQLKWSDKSSNESGFAIYRGTSKSSLSKVATVGANTTSYKQTPPKKDTTYYYDVRAYNDAGNSSATSIVSAKVSSSSSTKTIPKAASGIKVIAIGSSRSVESLDSAAWPDQSDAPTEFLLDPGTYSVSLHFITGDLTIESADPSHPATLKLPKVFNSSGVASNPTLSVKGSLTIRNINTTGGIDTVLLGSSEGADIDAEDIQMDGGAIWRGNGAHNAYFKDNEVLGKPRANVYSSFGGTVQTCVIDHSGTSVPIQQGGQMVNGQPVGEAAIRIMNVDNLTLKGIKTKPWFYKPGQEWKQDVQIRPASKMIQVINCNFYQPDVGDMTWRKPALPIQRVDFVDCTFVKSPNVTAGVDTITFSNCKVGSSTLNKTLTF